jgi:hypothetical protein
VTDCIHYLAKTVTGLRFVQLLLGRGFDLKGRELPRVDLE